MNTICTTNKVQLKRLHNLVQVLRDAAKDSRLRRFFTMHQFGYSGGDGDPEPNLCGTPACVLGHYAVRRDVQRTFMLRGSDVFANGEPIDFEIHAPAHFGITYYQARELFEGYGCNGAKTPTQAANYIERFIKRITS